ncbi:MAG TPA: hypothetical protein ENK57_07675 [Polyangiaceae bacterium]|nr:hypothetical protein [Polyangiaceae bacterium]
MHRRSILVLGLTLVPLFSGSAEARCAVTPFERDFADSPYVVEAVLERAGAPAHFRTVVVWKGGARAPATFDVGSRAGRGSWPWAEAGNNGQRYLLFLRPAGAVYSVRRCGASGAMSPARRERLEAAGAHPVRR